VNRIPDNFLPKIRGGLMMGGLWDLRTPGLGLKEKISDSYPNINMPWIGRGCIGSQASRPAGPVAAVLTTRRGDKKLTQKIASNQLKRLN
jgi:hypothetical protein